MSRSVLWSIVVFTVFAFAALMIFFWVREGSLEGAGHSMDKLLGKTGAEISSGTGQVVGATTNAVGRATDGDDKT